MSLLLKMIYGCLTGAWGGFVAWALLDPLLGIRPTSPYLDAVVNGAIIGVCIGALMGGFGGLVERNIKRFLRGLSSGLIMGLLGGVVGLVIGETLYQSLGQLVWVRAAGWAILGVAIGAGEGVLTRSWLRVLLGTIGGFAGGILGSLAFVLVKESMALPAFSRALGFTILGALIGLLIGLMPVAIKSFIATLKVISSGRNEGKEILVEKKLTRIGRDDSCELGLYGDPAVQPCHAEIRREPQGYVIRPVGGAPILVNGQPVQSHLLQKGDRVKIGRQEILFR